MHVSLCACVVVFVFVCWVRCVAIQGLGGIKVSCLGDFKHLGFVVQTCSLVLIGELANGL